MRKETELEFTSVRMTGSVGTPGEIIASEDEWFETTGATTGVLTGQILDISANITLIFETAAVAEGPWSTIEAMTSTSTAPVEEEYAGATFLSNEVDAPTSHRFDRWVRWRLVATDDAHICFHGFAVFQ
jgi:hypothetical protein